jgi:hypothetical protein
MCGGIQYDGDKGTTKLLIGDRRRWVIRDDGFMRMTNFLENLHMEARFLF